MSNDTASFWEHLDVLRLCLWRIILVISVGFVIAFCLKDGIFNIILAPAKSSFITYKLLGTGNISLNLINTGLTEQMMVHLKVALCCGILASSPYTIYTLYGFISPALYQNEKWYTVRLLSAAYLMFIFGILINYFFLFPLTVSFLGNYSISSDIVNMLSISSYIDTFLVTTLTFGILFELPVLSWLLARFGLLRASWMKKYRRHAFVAILTVAAIITPTTDIFSLIIVTMPIWLLYELSIFIVSKTTQQNKS